MEKFEAFSLIFLLFISAMSIIAQSNFPRFPKDSLILFQGDSITDGGRGKNADPNHIMGHSYPILVAAPTAAKFPQMNYTFLNRGISGNKITDLEARWQKDTFDLKPDFLSILIGVNDAAAIVNKGVNAISADEFEKKYDLLLAETLKHLPNVKLILCEPFIFDNPKIHGKFSAYKEEVDNRREAIERLVKKYNLPLVHFQKMFEEAEKKAPIEYWIWDGVHPTFAGHQLMADEWVKTVNEFIKKNNWKAKTK